jgi:hypothetical protein
MDKDTPLKVRTVKIKGNIRTRHGVFDCELQVRVSAVRAKL